MIVAGFELPSSNYLVARLLEDGSLDSSFGTGGKEIGTTDNISHITGIKLNKEGKIVLFGNTTAASKNLVVIQLNSDGSPDTNFGTNGSTEVNFGGTEITLSDFAIDGQGRIVIVGQTNAATNPNDFAIARLLPDGSLDTTFGTNGKVQLDLGNNLASGGIAITRAGKIIILGSNITGADQMIVAQLNNDGSLDTNFGMNGSTVIGVSSNPRGNGGIAINSQGKIYVFGNDSNIFIVSRLEKDGSLDSSFGNNGTKIIPLNVPVDGFGGITIDAQGRIVVLGTSQNPAQFTVVRLCGDTLPAFVVALREKVHGKLPVQLKHDSNLERDALSCVSF